MKKIKRWEPIDGATLDDLLIHQEMLIMWSQLLLKIVKRAAMTDCARNNKGCLACDALALITDLGETL
jgi:hypothetical protein